MTVVEVLVVLWVLWTERRTKPQYGDTGSVPLGGVQNRMVRISLWVVDMSVPCGGELAVKRAMVTQAYDEMTRQIYQEMVDVIFGATSKYGS